MQKIMFNDALGLTQAVLEGRKTQTRREIKCPRTQHGIDVAGFEVHKFSTGFREVVALDYDGREIGALEPTYKIGEVVAIALSYEELANDGYLKDMTVETDKGIGFDFKPEYRGAGWRNKMFVKAELMPHHIKITGIKIERLQDISVKDCLEEGIEEVTIHEDMVGDATAYRFHGSENYATVKKAYHALIDELDKKMWERNPFVFVYEFELVVKGYETKRSISDTAR